MYLDTLLVYLVTKTHLSGSALPNGWLNKSNIHLHLGQTFDKDECNKLQHKPNELFNDI